MRGLTMIQSSLLLGLCTALAGCAGSTPTPEDPSSNDAAQASPAPASAETASTESMSDSSSLDVGMEFKDNGDDENRRASHEAPPTAAWKPLDKEKAKDKTAEPKKPENVTAAR